MEIAFFSGTTLSIILFLWQFTYCLSGYNRTFAGITATMMQNAVIINIGDDVSLYPKPVAPYFGERIVDAIVRQYVDETLPRETIGGSYWIRLDFSSYQRTLQKRYNYYPMEVTITLAYSSPAYSATRNKSFRITEGAAHES